MRPLAALAGLAFAASCLGGCAAVIRLPVPPASIATRRPRPQCCCTASRSPPPHRRPCPRKRRLPRWCSTRAATAAGSAPPFRCSTCWRPRGQPAVGLSSRAFLKIERPGKARLSLEQLRLDYSVILDRARQALAPAARDARDPDRLVARRGLRGPGRAETHAVPAPAGVIAIGLDDGEDLAIDGPEDETDDAPRSTAPAKSPLASSTVASNVTFAP